MGKKIVIVLMIFSFILLTSANMKSNIKRITRHPMLWGVVFWSSTYLLANGDLASLLLFGSFGTFALFAMFSANMRGAKKQEMKYLLATDVITIVVGLIPYSVFIFLPPFLFGMSVI